MPADSELVAVHTMPVDMGTLLHLLDTCAASALASYRLDIHCQRHGHAHQQGSRKRYATEAVDAFQALGINEIVSITTDPLSALKQKVADEGITLPVLSDPSLAVSQAYSTNSYGMMGTSRDGHSFIVVGPDGTIKWRADYGGAPNYTMYVPVPNLLADIRAGLAK